jgi:carboxypeptidase family protein
MGIITGRIFRRDNGWPLTNAHLQMIGTPFVAFTDDQGWYTFRFDADLVEDCRTQMVRVTAPGYRTQWLSVVVAPGARTSDVVLERGQ